MAIPEQLRWIPTGETLGRGGQGTIHIVLERGKLSKGKYALKELHKRGDEKARKRFQNEVESIKRIDQHPSIIKVLDHSRSEDDFQYYVMEYHEDAQSLTEITLESSPNPYEEDTLKSLELFEKIIKAIQVCENLSITHRDISPNNILVLKDGSIRLIDFGLCHTIGNDPITLAGENLGTRNYAPPECGSGSTLRIDTYTDIYSAAKVLWSTITSERVFDREDPILTNKSMEKMFPYNEETWHLNRIFNETIRENPNDRFGRTELVLLLISEVRHAVKGGFPPLEAIEKRCPSCGLKGVKLSPSPYPFTDIAGGEFDTEDDFKEYVCNLCGFVFARRHDLLDNTLGKEEEDIPF